MNVQPMALDLNALRAPQRSANQQVSGKKEDDFSSVLEKSREKQETPSKPKVNKEKKNVTQTSKEKVSTDPKTPDTKEASKSQETTTEEDIVAKEQNEKVTQAVANLLNITVNELETMLATLQISMSDLLKGDNLQQLMMQVHGVEEPMALLLIPEVISEIKAISSVVEDYTANMVAAQPEMASLAVTSEIAAVDPQEFRIKPEAQVATGANQKNTDEAPKANVENTEVEADIKSEAKINVANPNNENLSQTEEQSTPNQKNAANQFLDNLSQSMGDVFRSQNNQVNEAFETIAKSTEVVNPRMVLDQIVEKIKVSALENEAKMNIQLKPEHLGKMSVEVISKQGIMTAQITVENEKTKALLEQNIQRLRDSLEDTGLVIQELEVAVGQNQDENQQTYASPKSNKNISDLINTMMNEDIVEEDIKPDNLFDYDANEVDFIA